MSDDCPKCGETGRVQKTQKLVMPATMYSCIPLMPLGSHDHDSTAQVTVADRTAGHKG